MFRSTTIFWGTLVAFSAFGQTNPVALPPAQAAGYSLSFFDNFDSIDLSPNGSGAHNWYQSLWWDSNIPSRSLINTSNSVLSLTWQRGQGSWNTSITTFAHDKSQGRTWRYGYFEARMKWDVVNGSWPAFWLIPSQDATGQNVQNGVKETGEIDVFEGQGNRPTTFYGTVHDWINNQDSTNTPNWYALPSGFNFNEFHNYGVLWVPGHVTWYLDDQPLFTAPTPPVVDRQDFFIVLGSQEGANWQGGSMNGVTAQALNLNVDWVRVWQNR